MKIKKITNYNIVKHYINNVSIYSVVVGFPSLLSALNKQCDIDCDSYYDFSIEQINAINKAMNNKKD